MHTGNFLFQKNTSGSSVARIWCKGGTILHKTRQPHKVAVRLCAVENNKLLEVEGTRAPFSIDGDADDWWSHCSKPTQTSSTHNTGHVREAGCWPGCWRWRGDSGTAGFSRRRRGRPRWVCAMCCHSPALCLYDLPQALHEYGLSPVCTRTWLSSVDLRAKHLPQYRHLPDK